MNSFFKRKPTQSVNIITVTNDKIQTEIIAVIANDNKALRRLKQEIKGYIASWYQGKGQEPKTARQYYDDGWSKPNKSRSQTHSWKLDEGDWYTEYAISKYKID